MGRHAALIVLSVLLAVLVERVGASSKVCLGPVEVENVGTLQAIGAPSSNARVT